MKMVSSPHLRCLLLLLSLTASISCSSAAQRDSKLRLLLHRTPLLGSKQDTSRASLAELLLSDLLQMENEALDDDSFPLAEGEPEDVRVDLERAAAGSGPLLCCMARPEDVHTRRPENMSELKQLCQEEQSEAPPERGAGLIHSHRKRWLEVIGDKGGSTSCHDLVHEVP
uniref:somatostatin-1-like n=1 Tax=Monopterus albus TaxID=43700 RepID=UPI0009B3FD9F|nr:somatostatin-1-like [Monopterus albus]